MNHHILDNLLSKLDKVQQRGAESYSARCPAHNDKTPSLNISVKPDGRILIHCFSQCAPVDILGSIGLDFNDLFPKQLGEFKSGKHPFSPRLVLSTLAYESNVVLICANYLRDGEKLNPENHARLVLAVSRIQEGLRMSGL